MHQSWLYPAALLAGLFCAAPVAAAGNFEFAVAADPGLTLRITGYRADGSQLFEAASGTAEQRDGQSVYVIRIDETVVKDGLARWCVEDASGRWPALKDHAGATGLCDDQPSETRGRYQFEPRVALGGAVEVPEMDLAEAAKCVQAGLQTIGYDPGPADGQMGKRTFNAALQFAGVQDGAPYPELSDETAAAWCARLTAAIADGSAQGPDDSLARFRFGPDVDVAMAKDVRQGIADIAEYFETALGGKLKTPGTIYVSADPVWLTDSYVAHLNQGQGIRRGKLENFTACNGGEAAYGFMFMCSKSDVFSGDWFGSGRAAQRAFAMAHEYFHMLQYERAVGSLAGCCGSNTLKTLGPQWLVEGAAEYVAFRMLADTGRMKRFKREIAWHTEKAAEVKSSLEKMQTRPGYYAEPRSSSAGMIAAHLLAEEAGLQSLAQFYTEIGERKDWVAAFEAAFGMTPEVFSEKYEAHVH